MRTGHPMPERAAFTRILAAAALLISVSACALGPYDKNELAGLPPTDSQFLTELSAEYATLGDMEKAEYDWPDTARFYDRAIRSAKGETIEPEALEARDLPPAARKDLAAARQRLIVLFASGARSIVGKGSARAQAGFDCWMQEAEEDHQPDDIENCREMFLAAVKEVESSVGGALFVLLPDSDGKIGEISVSNGEGAVTLASARASALVAGTGAPPRHAGTFAPGDVTAVFGDAIAAAPEAPVTFMLYFEQGTDQLTPESEARLESVLEAIRKRKLPQVEVSGHTDRSGSVNYNYRLALERAKIVAVAILGLGVPERVVTVESYGERDPVVPTADGVSQPRNRRVEIVIR